MRAKYTARRWMLGSGLPEDALTGAARITLSGKSAALVEGQRGVVEMSDERIRLKSRSGIICIQGRSLRLQELSLDAAIVTGKEIAAVLYEGSNQLR